ncbi:MAG: hypothetical protein FJ388_21305, partial [Verrucomicrobia bacterium]|nr:hypothetical protein [Verrucomicrobiota bacterium]
MALSTQAVHERLRGAARTLRWSRSVRYTLTGVALAMLSMLVCLLLDSRFHFDALGRWVSFVLVMVPLALGTALTMWAWRPTVSEERIARRIESRSSLRGNVLISAVQFDRELAADSPLRRALFEEMQDPFPGVHWSNVFDAELLKRLALVLGGVALGIAVCALIMPRHFANSAARIILPASDIAPLTRTQILEVSPGTTRIVHGRDLTVSVKLGGEIPKAAWIYFREVGSSWRKEAMNREVGLPMFHYRWSEVRQSMDFYVVAGDVRSAIHRVTVRPA